MAADPARLEESDRFWFHELDLRPESDVLFRAFHKDSIQRKIRRAEREDIRCEEGRTAELLAQFYRLLVVTRRRHGLPPQPFQWFCCLADCLGESFCVRVARQRGRPIAAMITLRHRDVTVYKYGASDATAHNTGAVPLLFWKAIQDARAAGCAAFDLGRTDFENSGLATFKDRLGAARTSLSYWRSLTGAAKKRSSHGWVASRVSEAFSHLPAGLRITAGELLYKHVG
jgi:lipid II:glycine glycyltransferase (peptidoglycan interpeptide bridge formation enzyme)